jgi:patatin-like phospholipase/acyl hydrolase
MSEAAPRARNRKLCLLSLDGGGVRGLSSLFILKQLMESVNPDKPPRPCDHFDMIGGTSTGGLIALMLGRLGLTVDECIQEYADLARKVFTKLHHRINVKGKVQGRFNHVAIEDGVRGLLQRMGLEENALLFDPTDPPCKT